MVRKIGWALAAVLSFQIGAPPLVRGGEPDCAAQKERPSKPEARQDRHTIEPFENHPRYAWWKDDKAKAAAGFSAEQAAEIDRIFRESISKMSPLRKEVIELQKALSVTINENTADIPTVAHQIEKVESRRAELNKMRLIMLYRMQRVLLPEQNTRLLAYFDRRDAERGKQSDRRK